MSTVINLAPRMNEQKAAEAHDEITDVNAEISLFIYQNSSDLVAMLEDAQMWPEADRLASLMNKRIRAYDNLMKAMCGQV